MILRSTKDNTNKITDPSIKAFMDDVTQVADSRSHGITGDPLTEALQMGSDENKPFKMPQFINY